MSTNNHPVVEEVVARLRLAGDVLFEWRCTPAELEALALGRLYAEGMIENADVAQYLEIRRDGRGEIEMTIQAELSTRPVLHAAGTLALPDGETFGALFRMLFSGVDQRHPDGGMHAAALAAGGNIAFQAEDVGRHNAVDKVIGLSLLAHQRPSDYGMLVSSRISGEIARKAARAGVSWLASRSIPTTLAVSTARDAGMSLVGRAAGKGAVIYE